MCNGDIRMDRKLDCWVFESVFGMSLIPEGSPDKGGWIKAAHYRDPSGREYSSVNGPEKYTSDMNHAWKVVEKMEELGVMTFLRNFPDRPQCKFLGGGKAPESSYADTMPMAICLAAYKHKTGKDWDGQ